MNPGEPGEERGLGRCIMIKIRFWKQTSILFALLVLFLISGECAATLPELSVSPNSHDFGTTETSCQLTVTNIELLRVAEKLSPGRYRLYEREKTLARIRQIKSIVEQNRTLKDIREELAKSLAG